MIGTAGPADFYIELKMVLCSSHDGVPLKFKKKNGRASSLQGRILFGPNLGPSLNSMDNTFQEPILTMTNLFPLEDCSC
jgi:hypothetical protein